jgi:hypothetical protein
MGYDFFGVDLTDVVLELSEDELSDELDDEEVVDFGL